MFRWLRLLPRLTRGCTKIRKIQRESFRIFSRFPSQLDAKTTHRLRNSGRLKAQRKGVWWCRHKIGCLCRAHPRRRVYQDQHSHWLWPASRPNQERPTKTARELRTTEMASLVSKRHNFLDKFADCHEWKKLGKWETAKVFHVFENGWLIGHHFWWVLELSRNTNSCNWFSITCKPQKLTGQTKAIPKA